MAASNLNPILAALQPSASPASQPTAAKAAPQAASSQDDSEFFQPAENGPFRCDNCVFYQQAGQCSEPEMIARYGDDTGNGATTNGGQVSDGSCCSNFKNKGGAS